MKKLKSLGKNGICCKFERLNIYDKLRGLWQKCDKGDTFCGNFWQIIGKLIDCDKLWQNGNYLNFKFVKKLKKITKAY